MKCKIEPRKITDKGGYLTMPLMRNVPVGRKDWARTLCPNCGRACWDRPLPEGYGIDMFEGKLCTVCVVTMALRGEEE